MRGVSVAVLARPDARAGAQEVPIGISMSDLIMDQFVDLANAGSRREERFTRSPRAEPREQRQIGPYPAQDGRFEVAKKPPTSFQMLLQRIPRKPKGPYPQTEGQHDNGQTIPRCRTRT